MRYYLPPLVCAALIVALILSTYRGGEQADRSVYDVNWEDASWCVYSRLDPGFTGPEKLAKIMRFCTVVGEGTYIAP